jgi:hypothetical protein
MIAVSAQFSLTAFSRIELVQMVLSALAPASTTGPEHRVRYAAVRMLITVRERERICRRAAVAGGNMLVAI